MRAIVCILLVLPGLGVAPRPDDGEKSSKLALSEPIACRKIKGFKDYEPLDRPAVKATQKLLLYVEPSGMTYARSLTDYTVHLTMDVNVRRKNHKKILWGRKHVIDYEADCKQPDTPFYLEVVLGLKDTPPGEYEADLVLHDELGTAKPITRTFEFRVIPDNAPTDDSKADSNDAETTDTPDDGEPESKP